MNLEDRIKRRLVVEDPDVWDHDRWIGEEWHLFDHEVQVAAGAHIAILEAEDSANPIAATAVVRPGLELTFDHAAFQAVLDDLEHD